MHFAGPVAVGADRQCCGRCGEVLQQVPDAGFPDIAVWPEGVPVVRSAGRWIPFEGVTPGQFPECSPETAGGMTAARARPFQRKVVA